MRSLSSLQLLLERLRAAAGGGLERVVDDRDTREFLRQSPARPSPARARPPIPPAARPSAQGPSLLLRRRDQVVDLGEELLVVELSDRGRLQDPAGVGVDEGGAAADPVEVGECPVAVEADGMGPVVLPDQLLDLGGAVADVDREKVDLRLVTAVRPLEDVLLVLAVPAAREPERKDQRLVEVGRTPGSPRVRRPGRRAFAGCPADRGSAQRRSRPGRCWRRRSRRSGRRAPRTAPGADPPRWSRPSTPLFFVEIVLIPATAISAMNAMPTISE